ncbi:putative xyloglucan endotransglucosylase/hydrolase protein 33 [Apium graveolens]|uniref:putative xyloglucan endotransglucosylase/hydrolase protein 33 n=1 Tax=Apium graveolens TaxID=4045 RepID=UPI003D7B4F6E
MSILQMRSFLLVLFICSSIVAVSSRGPIYKPPPVERLTDRFVQQSVDKAFSNLYGNKNIHQLNNGSSVNIILDKSSGSGLISKNRYYYGFFSAAIKLPASFTSGVVVAFYLSNSDMYPHNHDEIDFELLGHEKRRDWVLQTNIYGNGSTKTGREEKFYLWFDPTIESHQYSILWNNHHTVFLVDNVPVREVVHNAAIASAYPSKPMSVYATIWDASEWATHGGKYAVNYKYAPFVASLGQIEMGGCIKQRTDSTQSCVTGPSTLDPVEGQEFAKLSKQQTTGMDWARRKHMFYSYCKDTSRYKVLPAECNKA